MISVILPYWKRPEVTRQSLELYEKHYVGVVDFEVVIVDDGSHDLNSDDLQSQYPWLHIVQLPKKEVALNPCVPINAGVKYSVGDVIVISNPEIMHTVPVLHEMLTELDGMGPNGYVLAACWFEDDKRWHCHSSITANGYHEQIKQPKGSGFHFCAMLNRSLWDRAGGFDEEYRNGWCYDDDDWVMRVNKAGGIFKIRDDLVVQHVRKGATANFNLPSNKGLYLSKWESA